MSCIRVSRKSAELADMDVVCDELMPRLGLMLVRLILWFARGKVLTLSGYCQRHILNFLTFSGSLRDKCVSVVSGHARRSNPSVLNFS